LKPDPIIFDININGQTYHNTASSEVTISLCTIVDLSVKVSNKSDESRGPLLLTIEPYQDQAFGCPVTELDGKVTWVGTLKLHTSQLLPGSSVCHSCSLVFLYTGQYMVSISCNEVDTERTETKAAASMLAERTRNSQSKKPNLMEESHRNVLKKSWTYSPPIKINVV